MASTQEELLTHVYATLNPRKRPFAVWRLVATLRGHDFGADGSPLEFIGGLFP